MQRVSAPNLRAPDLALVPADMTAEGRRFGANLKRLREDMRLTQGELARLVRVSFGLISQYERGSVQFPRRDIVDRLAAALGVTVADLLDAEPQPRTPGETIDERIRQLERRLEELPTRLAPAPLFPRDARILRFLGRAGADPRAGEDRLAPGASTDQYTLRAIGDCLEPEVLEGDTLTLSVDKRPVVGDIVALAVNGELHLKMVWHDPNGQLVLWSKRGMLKTTDEGVEVLGTIIEIARPVVRRRYDLSNGGSNGGVFPDLAAAP